MRVLVQNAELPQKQDWFDLPMGTPNSHMEETYRLIHIGRKPDGYISSLVIAKVESEIENLGKYIRPNTSMEAKDSLSKQIEKMSEEEKSAFTEKLNIQKTKAIEDVIFLAKEIATPTMAFSMLGGM